MARQSLGLVTALVLVQRQLSSCCVLPGAGGSLGSPCRGTNPIQGDPPSDPVALTGPTSKSHQARG